ncbi:unnamed protein product [Lactuca virosa]|uniref:Uncharacterized protein n=1 Tax=Lactuca virosa TaxID=75947 RepID=A0AAU9MPA3_9ASTR|nr:unnamed protein product [Lactuca virosa]
MTTTTQVSSIDHSPILSDLSIYKQLVRAIQYASISSPDIAFSVTERVNSCMHLPKIIGMPSNASCGTYMTKMILACSIDTIRVPLYQPLWMVIGNILQLIPMRLLRFRLGWLPR